VTHAVFIDIQRAFDKVWKDGLLIKLLHSDIQGVGGLSLTCTTAEDEY
jgi:hypothetical protein